MSRPALPLRRIVLALTVMTGCASAPSAILTPSEPPPVAPPAPVEPPALPLTELPWLMLEREADLGPVPNDLPLPSTVPTAVGSLALLQLSKELPRESLPPSYLKLLGERLKVYASEGAAHCDVVVAGFAVQVPFDPDSGTAGDVFYPPEPYDEDGDGTPDGEPPVPEEVRFRKAFDEGPKRLVATLRLPDGRPYEGCVEGELDFLVGRDGIAHLEATETVPKRLEREAFKALRSHGFWDLQQDAYVRSLEQERTRVRLAIEAGKHEGMSRSDLRELAASDRSLKAPKTWEESTQDWSTPTLRLWEGARGDKLLVLEVGNGYSCAAPRGWMAFRVSDDGLETIAFDVGKGPLGFIDIDQDGRFEMMREYWVDKRIDELDPALALPPKREMTLDGWELHCGWEDLPPLSGQPE
jgi:hypothetical protein